MPALPPDFAAYTRELFGPERYERYLRAFDEDTPVSIRVNPFKAITIADSEPVPWCRDAYWLPQRQSFTLDPLFHAGCYYVQEAASMFLDTVIRQYVTTPVIALDLCAAPGGKATLLRAALPKGSVLHCNEYDHRRANILVENMQKQGHTDVIVTSNAPRDFATAKMQYDVIVCDVPCSGEGLFRRDSSAMAEWSVTNVRRCVDRQRSIISDIWPCLKTGGIMVYSTCTYNTRENEENISWLVNNYLAEVLPVTISPHWGVTQSLLPSFTAPVYRFIPGITRSEGLFLAVIRKVGGTVTTGKQHPEQLYTLYDGRCDLAALSSRIPPPHAVALRHDLPAELFPQVEIDYALALRYLRREAITVPPDTPRGYVIVTYKHHPLGFVKNIGSRANNLYPAEWRIKHK